MCIQKRAAFNSTYLQNIYVQYDGMNRNKTL